MIEIGDSPLIFVLKMDEAEIVKGQKMERVSIMLMNRALDPTILHDKNRYYSVQSKWDILPVACFQVGKETHEVLKLIFKHTHFPEIIDKQSASEKLVVDGMGEYNVEWHLSGDLKTLKCLFGVQHGPCAKYSSCPILMG